MSGSSPSPRRSFQWASPQRSIISEILNDDRNSEARHRLLIETAKREHDRVREDAERVYRDHLQREEKQRILDEKKKEEERIRLEEQIAAERTRLNALKAKKVEVPPPAPEPLPEPEPKPKTEPEPRLTKPPPASAGAPATATPLAVPAKTLATAQPSQVNSSTTQSVAPPAANPFAASLKQATPAQPAAPVSNGLLAAAKPAAFPAGGAGLFGKPVQNNATATPSSQTAQPAVQPPAQRAPDRYTIIHKNLKELRKSLLEQAKVNRALKDRMGDMRREIRKSVGQLTGGGAGTNRQQQHKIVSLLREALANGVQSQLMDPSNFIVEPRNPVEGAANNAPQVPSLFLYLLNVFAKATISQFINEAGARPETADPVGVCIAATFSEPDFLWRGVSVIDILIAKFRVVCPVLFGYRGSEKTEQGRQRIGWWKDNGSWISEQQHMDRMTGLGAGFAAISLRKFAKAKKENPYPPRNYWTAMAKIVNTPAGEISNTQCVVLKSMVQNYESKFIEFYGTAAIAALRTALLEFPARATEKSSSVSSLPNLAQILKRDTGLVLG
ncbi:GLE1-like protein-domain-containing protein [Podospora appendiculata]|uniref:mRNA export factor GLE1 n=1 Tax=Podospora appendiculata TaxID=314037 RepID=A0AAE0X539_9PEZI|nr:GLE1-like protein-domain-containing protein [Podospora appendiculata]